MELFTSLPLWGNVTIFAAAAVVVWFCGVRLEGAVQTISTRTGLGSAFGGMVLLAIATSLPELATTVTGGILGNAELVTNNLLGGVAMQTAILAVADVALRRGALTHFAPQFTLLLGGVSLVMLLGVTLTVMTLGDTIAIAAVGLGTTTIFVVHVTLAYLTYRSRGDPRWEAIGQDEQSAKRTKPPEEDPETSLRKAWLVFAAASAGVLVAGWLVMMTAEALTHQTKLGASFIGATLVAIATSLPELSTTITAVRRGHHALAISNIFGSNLWDVSLLFVADIFFRSGPLLEAAPRQAMFTCSLGLVMTAIYLWGLLERKDRTIWRFGIDSTLVLAIYLAGLVVLYRMG